MPQDRALSILCTFSGSYNANGPKGPGYYGAMTYSLVGANPPVSDPAVVAPAGGIYIDKWPNPDPAVWSDIVDITFSLAGNCTLRDGTVVPVVWSPNMNNDPNGQPAMLLTDLDSGQPAPTSDAEARWVAGSNQTQILVDDKNEEKNFYFRPAIIVPAANNYYISCDPPLVNKGKINR